MASPITFTATRGLSLTGTEAGAWLASTTAETVGVDETTQLLSGDDVSFTSSIGNWVSATTYTATAAAVSGEMQITPTVNYGKRYIPITTIVGQVYKVTATHRLISGSGGSIFHVSTATHGGTTNLLASATINGTSTAVTATIEFRATGTTTYIHAGQGGAATGVCGIDNVIITKSGNLVSNGTFGVDVAWTNASTGTGTAAIAGGVLTLASGTPYASNRGIRNASISGLTIGMTYTLVLTNTSANVGRLDITPDLETQDIPASATTSFTFVAAATSRTLTLYSPRTDGTSCVIDNVSVRLATPDLTANNHGAEIHGQLTTTAVA